MITPLTAQHSNQLFIIGETFEDIVGAIKSIIRELVFRRQ